jgi:hypothetical protein
LNAPNFSYLRAFLSKSNSIILNIFSSASCFLPHAITTPECQEVGWDSEKAGYDGLVEVAHKLYRKHTNKAETQESTVGNLTLAISLDLLSGMKETVVARVLI